MLEEMYYQPNSSKFDISLQFKIFLFYSFHQAQTSYLWRVINNIHKSCWGITGDFKEYVYETFREIKNWNDLQWHL